MPERRFRGAIAAIAASWFLVVASGSIGAPSATATLRANGQISVGTSSSVPIQVGLTYGQVTQTLPVGQYAPSLNTESDFGVVGVTPQLDASNHHRSERWHAAKNWPPRPPDEVKRIGVFTIPGYAGSQTLRTVWLRRGYYSRKPSGADSGYGLRKIVEKHALDEYAPSAIAFYGVIVYDNGNEVRMTAPITHFKCAGWGIFRKCKAVETLTAIMVAYLNNMGGANADGHQLGVNTAYCKGYYGACPDWAANALNKVVPIWIPDS